MTPPTFPLVSRLFTRCYILAGLMYHLISILFLLNKLDVVSQHEWFLGSITDCMLSRQRLSTSFSSHHSYIWFLYPCCFISFFLIFLYCLYTTSSPASQPLCRKNVFLLLLLRFSHYFSIWPPPPFPGPFLPSLFKHLLILIFSFFWFF